MTQSNGAKDYRRCIDEARAPSIFESTSLPYATCDLQVKSSQDIAIYETPERSSG